MPDFPYATGFHGPVINPWARESPLAWASGDPLANAGGGTTSTAWPTNNLVFLCPITIWAPYLVRSVFWVNGTSVSGNNDCGLYTRDAAELLFNCGSTTASGVSVPQGVAVGPYLLEPGTYYMALCVASTSNHVQATASVSTLMLQVAGCAQAANGSLPLAASQTLATPSSFGGTCVPSFGISSRTSTLI